VTYRDDHDAAIARAEALEREAAELREKASRLEAENAVLAKERAELAEQVEAPRRALARLAGKDTDARAEVLVRRPPGALVSSALHAHTGLAVLGAASPTVAVIAAAAAAGIPGGFFVIAGLGALAGGITLLRSLVAFDERRERELLASLPLPIDIPAYLAYLDEPHIPTAHVTVRVELEREPDGPTRAQLLSAVAHAVSDSRPRFVESVLTITSLGLRTETSGQPDNVRLHRWVRRLIARALLPIAAAHPVRRITIE
jgi:hypothetical protein